MRLVLVILTVLFFGAGTSRAQSVYPIRTDLLKVYSGSGAGAELQLQNATQNVVGGVLTNTNSQGLTEFRLPVNLYTASARIQGTGINRIASGFVNSTTRNSLIFDTLANFEVHAYGSFGAYDPTYTGMRIVMNSGAGVMTTGWNTSAGTGSLTFSPGGATLFGQTGTTDNRIALGVDGDKFLLTNPTTSGTNNLFRVDRDGGITAYAYPNPGSQFLTTDATGKLALSTLPAATINATNGLNFTAGAARLGGTLTTTTAINTGGNGNVLVLSDISSAGNVARLDVGNGQLLIQSQFQGTGRLSSINARTDGSILLRSNNNGQAGEDAQFTMDLNGTSLIGSLNLTTNNASSGAYSVLVRNTSTTKVETVPSSTFLTSVPNIQAVTTAGNRTTLNVEAGGFYLYQGSTFIGALSNSGGWPRFGAPTGQRAELSADGGSNLFTVLPGTGSYRFNGQPPAGNTSMRVLLYDPGALGATDPNIKSIPGNSLMLTSTRSITGNYTVAAGDQTIFNKNTSGSSNTLTLPDPTLNASRILILAEMSANTANWMTFSLAVRWSDAQTITNMTGNPFNVNRRLIIQSDGTEWLIIGM